VLNISAKSSKSTKKAKCAIYARVSTPGQHLKQQVDAIKEYAIDNHYHIYHVYTDKISGTRYSRPGLDQLLIDMRAGCFDTVLCWKLDRLGRSLPHLFTVTGEMKNKDVNFICTSQPSISTDSPVGKVIFAVLGALAEMERDIRSEQTKLGLKNAVGVGKRGPDKHSRKLRGSPK